MALLSFSGLGVSASVGLSLVLTACADAGAAGAAGAINSPSSLASRVWILPRTSANTRCG